MHTNQLPDSLVAQLRTFEKRLRRMETIAAIGGGIAGLFITYVLLFASDRVVNTPIAARLALSVSGAALAALFAQGWAHRWLWFRRGPAQLAKLLQKHFRVLGDRLQGVIELTQTDTLPENISPALLRAAIRQVADDSGKHDFRQAVPVRPARRWAFAAVVVTALSAAPFVLVPRAATNAVKRWAMPWADIERYTFTTVEQLPSELYVAHGEEFPLIVGLRADAEWKPGSASARIDEQPKIVAEVVEGQALFKFPGQTREGTIALRFGDYLKDIAVHPLHRPELKDLSARVKLPEYLGYPELKTPIQGSGAEFLEGSEISFAGKISRGVRTGTLTAAGSQYDATAEAETFFTPFLPLAALGTEVSLRWADVHGLTPVQPYALRVAAAKDQPPRVEIQGLPQQEIAILPHESVRFTVAAGDDFGVKESWVGWSMKRLGELEAEAARPPAKEGDWMNDIWKDWETGAVENKTKATAPSELPRIAGGQTVKEMTRPLVWAPAEAGVPQDSVVELSAYVLDYLPKRAPVQSSKFTIYVLSPEKHAERVRERMDQVLKQIDERIRDEERAIEENRNIAESKDLGSERAGDEIKRVEASEKANEEGTRKLVEQMKDVMKDALRNQEIPNETMNEWSKIAETLEQKAMPQMSQAQDKMSQASQSPQQREQQMKEAMQNQENALEALREAANKMQKANENLFARNFYNRLKHAATTEFGISDGLKKLAALTVGLKPDEIGDGERKEFDGVAGRQDAAVKDVDGLQNDMTLFLRRVPNEKYQKVVTEMEEMKMVGELTELAGYVRANLGLKSLGRARVWGDQFNKWAEMIQGESQNNNNQGEQGEMDPDQMELMIAMVRAAVAEDNIRELTGDLDRQRETNTNHAADSAKLGVAQSQLGGAVREIRDNPRFAKFMGEVGPLLMKVEELMQEVAGELRKPVTGPETIATESTIIELLVPPDNKSNSQSQSQNMANMQRRMQQMMQQMSKGSRPGHNASRNASNLAGIDAEGPGSGERNTNRLVDKSGGASNVGEWPEEFRDALQSYLQSIEERKN